MDDTPTPAPGPLARARAWLRGDRFMVDSRPPNPVAETAAVGAHVTTAHARSKETLRLVPSGPPASDPPPAEVATLQATAAGAMA